MRSDLLLVGRLRAVESGGPSHEYILVCLVLYWIFTYHNLDCINIILMQNSMFRTICFNLFLSLNFDFDKNSKLSLL